MPRRLLALIALASVLALGCFAPEEPPSTGAPRPAALVGTGWRVVLVNGRAPVAGREPTLAFEAERVGGSGGCNQFGGRYRYDPASGAFQITDAAMTAMGCAERAVNEFEGGFMVALPKTTTAGLDLTGRLLLLGPGTEIVLAANPGTST